MSDNQIDSGIGIRLLTLYDQLKNTGKVKSQKEFAEKIGVLPSHITELKKGRSKISIKKLQQITGELSKYKEWIITGDNSPFASGEFTIDGFSGRNIERLADGRYVIPESMWIDYMKRIELQNEQFNSEEELRVLKAEVDVLRKEISTLKKTDVPEDNAECADVS